ncbi:MAG: 16S rRNA (cytidine(1402)-2'-O)-methyltransferase [Bacteroidia bacterium]|nr:16S rRNA (cytidine(1402)-2'-O)-methyltransferase [Bacteroidia bacterium]
MSKLILVPTPIGNLKDITLRSIEVLESVDIVFSEDTRVTGKLLAHLNIKKPLKAYHAHNEHQSLEYFLDLIKQNSSAALVSDAGTPGISDPGFLLVRACIERNISVETLPGPTAFVPALLQSGLPCDKFFFEGFLPHKKGRIKRLEWLKSIEQTFVLYESPHRINKCVDQIMDVFGPNHQMSISRELTKLHEETIRGTIEEVQQILSERSKLKGEIVVVVDGRIPVVS